MEVWRSIATSISMKCRFLSYVVVWTVLSGDSGIVLRPLSCREVKLLTDQDDHRFQTTNVIEMTAETMTMTCQLLDANLTDVRFRWLCLNGQRQMWIPCGTGQRFVYTVKLAATAAAATAAERNCFQSESIRYVTCKALGMQGNISHEQTSAVTLVLPPSNYSMPSEDSYRRRDFVVMVVAVVEFVLLSILLFVIATRSRRGVMHLMRGYIGRPPADKLHTKDDYDDGTAIMTTKGRPTIRPSDSVDEDGYILPIMLRDQQVHSTPERKNVDSCHPTTESTSLGSGGGGHYMEVSLEEDECYETPVESPRSPLYENVANLTRKHQ